MDLKIALQVDANNPIVGDLFLENGTVRITKSLSEEVAQALFIRFNFFQGEWFLDPTQGIPYFQSILGQKTPTAILVQLFRQIIVGCPGVAHLDTFRLLRDSKTRGIGIEFTCTLSDGTLLSSQDFGNFIVGA